MQDMSQALASSEGAKLVGL